MRTHTPTFTLVREPRTLPGLTDTALLHHFLTMTECMDAMTESQATPTLFSNWQHKMCKNSGKDSPSGVDIKTLISTESPDVLFITETPYGKDCPPLCNMLRNNGYHIHFRPTNDPTPQTDIPPEARLPTSRSGTSGGCMLAFKKKQPWSHAVSPVPLPPEFRGNYYFGYILQAFRIYLAYGSRYLKYRTFSDIIYCTFIQTIFKALFRI